MNVIEQTIEPKNGAIDFHIDVPQEWEGMKIKITLEPAQEITEKPKGTGLSRFRGIFKDMSPEEKADMDKQLTELRNEWERPI